MPDRLGPYEILGELGRGAMGVVWRGSDPALDREVAIKEPFLTPGLDPQVVDDLTARFIREAKASGRLSHPGIVTVYAADVFDGRPAIVMEFVRGETLATLLASGRLPPKLVTGVLVQLLDAVSYAHENGVIHRDIKPENVFVTDDGRVKLADFGLAQVTASSVLTQAGTILGTPGYMSPEQVTGQPADARSDVFSIAAVAYEMLVGKNPFGSGDGLPPTTVMYRVVHEEATAISAVRGEVPRWLARVISRGLEKDPERRYQSARAMLEDVQAQHAAADFEKASGPRRVVPASGSRRFPVWPALLATLAIMGVLAAAAVMLSSPRDITGRSRPILDDLARDAAPLTDGSLETSIPFQTVTDSQAANLGMFDGEFSWSYPLGRPSILVFDFRRVTRVAGFRVGAAAGVKASARVSELVVSDYGSSLLTVQVPVTPGWHDVMLPKTVVGRKVSVIAKGSGGTAYLGEIHPLGR